MLDERPQGIAVSGNDDALTRGNRGLNHFFPVGNDAGDRVFEAFGCGNEFRIDVSIPGICERTAGIPLGQRIGGRGVGTAPDKHLLFPVLGGGFGFV